MKELLELRVNYKYAHLLFKEDEGVNLGNPVRGYTIKVVKIDTSSSLFAEVEKVSKSVYEKYGECFFYGWEYQRKYSSKELHDAPLFKMTVRKYFEPSGEECGTEYDNNCACKLCGSGRKQISPLRIHKGRFLNKRDVATTLADEIVVSKRFVEVIRENDIKGISFSPVFFGKQESEDCFQLMVEGNRLKVDERTKFGGEPFEVVKDEENTQYISPCPNGDHLGLNLLSEVYVKYSPIINQYDFFISQQTFGVKNDGGPNRPLLRPHHILFCSPKLYRTIQENHLRGFNFEVAHIVD